MPPEGFEHIHADEPQEEGTREVWLQERKELLGISKRCADKIAECEALRDFYENDKDPKNAELYAGLSKDNQHNLNFLKETQRELEEMILKASRKAGMN